MKYIFNLSILLIVCINISSAQQAIDTINVSAGWNIIGALHSGRIGSSFSDVTDIITEPPGIVTSPFWGFIPGGGYYQADSLKRGIGYWVKVSQDGKIIYMSFTDCGTVDYAGKIYNTVMIGDQCWLKENLDVGTMINGIDTMKDNSVLEKYCYDDDPANCNTYGALYEWDEAMQYITTEGSQGICPPGWHIPTFAEFQTLAVAVSNDGKALKAIGQGTGSGAGTNTSGFSALLAGNRNYNGNFYNLGNYTYFWSSTEYSSIHAYDLSLYYTNSIIYLDYYTMTEGFCVRCLKD